MSLYETEIENKLQMLEETFQNWSKKRAKRLGRSPFHVAFRIYNTVPEDMDLVREELGKFIVKSSYKPPELYSVWVWPELTRILESMIPNPTSSWQKKIVDIFNGVDVMETDQLEYWAGLP